MEYPRIFVLRRHDDETGVSTAHGATPGQDVAWGCEFPDGPCVIRWCVSEVRQTAVFQSIDDVIAVHGHSGNTEVVWLPEQEQDSPTKPLFDDVAESLVEDFQRYSVRLMGDIERRRLF